MALDGIILNKVKNDLEKHLPIRINKINSTSNTEVIFNVHADKIRTSLVISLHSIYNHISLSDKDYSDYEEPSTFVMVLRKHLTNGIITSIEQYDFDRYLILNIRALNELYDEKEYLLSVELMGKYANLILIDKETNKIIDALKKIPPYQNTKRTILQGANFVLPEKQNKLNPYLCKSSDIDFDESLVKQLQGFSKQLEEEVRYRMNNNSFEEIIKEIENSNKLYISSNNEYHVIPLTYLNLKYEEYDISKGFDVLYYNANEKERIKTVTEDIDKFIKRQIKHYTLKVNKLKQNLEDNKNLLDDKENGDLLYTYSNLDQKGLNQIEINDYGINKIIKLDPKLSIKANANKYYNLYSKKRKGKVYIEEQIEIASKEAEYFNALKEQLDIASYNDALEIKEELIKYGYLKKKNKQKKNKKINLYQIKYGNHNIYFGKNNTQNDYLTFDFAKSNYMWFHAKDFHGAHLVIDSDNPNEDELRMCANIAAYFSKGRYSSSVPVNYCLVKNIKKVKGAKPGFVTIKNYKTIFIDPILDENIKIKSI